VIARAVAECEASCIEAGIKFRIVLGNGAKSLMMRKRFGETALHAVRHADPAIFTF
jgi:hypothetical protein